MAQKKFAPASDLLDAFLHEVPDVVVVQGIAGNLPLFPILHHALPPQKPE